MGVLKSKRVQPSNFSDLSSVLGLIEKELFVGQVYLGADGALLEANKVLTGQGCLLSCLVCEAEEEALGDLN